MLLDGLIARAALMQSDIANMRAVIDAHLDEDMLKASVSVAEMAVTVYLDRLREARRIAWIQNATK